MTKLQYAGLLLLMLLPLSVQGQGKIKLERGDDRLVIKGWIGDDNSFITNIGVTVEEAQGTTPIKLNIYPTDLKTADGTQRILRQSVSVTGDQTVIPNVTATYQVKITGVREPGEYDGNLYLTLANQSRDAAVAVEVKVVASVRPALTLLTENDRLQASVANCTPCPLAHALLPRSAFQNKVELGFEKPVGAQLVISDVTIAVKGDQTKYKLDADKLKLSISQLQQPVSVTNDLRTTRKYVTVPVDIDLPQIPADHYTGGIYLTIPGQANALRVPVELNVRSGPFWVVVILLISILLGRLFKFMQDKGNALADALQLINRLEFRLRDVHPDDAAIIEPMLGSARDLVHQQKPAEAVTAANAIAARLSALGELRQIQARLTAMEPTQPVMAILGDVNQAREEIRLQQDDKVGTLITKIKDALVALAAAPGVTDTDDTSLKDAINKADAASTSIGTIFVGRKKIRHRVRDALILLSGLSEQFRTEATLFLARPILWLALLLGLLALGLKTLYVDNPVFGANPFTDYLGLMFWGLSSDIASRTLSGLQLTTGNRPAGG